MAADVDIEALGLLDGPGDDGDFVSAREVCESTGVELELLQRLQRAVGLGHRPRGHGCRYAGARGDQPEKYLLPDDDDP